MDGDTIRLFVVLGLVGSWIGRALYRLRSRAKADEAVKKGLNKAKHEILVAFLSAVAISLAVYIAVLLRAPAPNHLLARQLGLGNAYVFAAILGGLLGLWLAWGGKQRIASLGGLLFGIFAGWLVWQWGQPHVWLIELVLASAFGPEAAVYTSFVTLFILFAVMRFAAEWGKKGMELLIQYFLRWRARREAAQALVAVEAEPL